MSHEGASEDILFAISGFVDYTSLMRICIVSRRSKIVALRALNRLRLDPFNLAEGAPYPYASYNARNVCLYTANRLLKGNSQLLTGLVALHILVPAKRILDWQHFLLEPICELIKARSPQLQYLSLQLPPMSKARFVSELWRTISSTTFPRLTDFKFKFFHLSAFDSLDLLKGMPKLRKLLNATYVPSDVEEGVALLKQLSQLVPHLQSLKMPWEGPLGSEIDNWSFASLFPNLKFLRLFSISNHPASWDWLDQLHFLPREVGMNLVVRWESFWFSLVQQQPEKKKELLYKMISQGFDPRRHDNFLTEAGDLDDVEFFLECYDLVASTERLPFVPRADKNGEVRDLDSILFNMLIGKNGTRFFSLIENNAKICDLLLSTRPENPLLKVPFAQHSYRLLMRSIFVGIPEFTGKLLTVLKLNLGISVNIQDGLGNTPLHAGGLCAYQDSAEIVKQLLSLGADLEITNVAGLKPVEYWAEQCGVGELETLLRGVYEFGKDVSNVELSSTHAFVALCYHLTSPKAPASLRAQTQFADFNTVEEYKQASNETSQSDGSTISWFRSNIEKTTQKCMNYREILRAVVRSFMSVSPKAAQRRALIIESLAIHIAKNSTTQLADLHYALTRFLPQIIEEPNLSLEMTPHAIARFLHSLKLHLQREIGAEDQKLPLFEQILGAIDQCRERAIEIAQMVNEIIESVRSGDTSVYMNYDDDYEIADDDLDGEEDDEQEDDNEEEHEDDDQEPDVEEADE